MTTFPPPVVPVFQPGFCPQQADFTSLWQNTAAFFQNRVVARVSQTTTPTTLPSSGALTVIGFDTVLEDPYSGWTGSPSFQWGPPAGYSGWYQVTITVRTGFATSVDLYVYLNTPALGASAPVTGAQLASNVSAGASGTFTTYLVGGQDAVQGAARLQNSSANVGTSLTAGQQSTLEVVWLSQS